MKKPLYEYCKLVDGSYGGVDPSKVNDYYAKHGWRVISISTRTTLGNEEVETVWMEREVPNKTQMGETQPT